MMKIYNRFRLTDQIEQDQLRSIRTGLHMNTQRNYEQIAKNNLQFANRKLSEEIKDRKDRKQTDRSTKQINKTDCNVKHYEKQFKEEETSIDYT